MKGSSTLYTVFVTGSLASGKHTACLYLVQKGFIHIDLDDIAKEFLQDELVVMQLIEHYGSDILDEEGSIDRGELAQRAFVDTESSIALNETIWPLTQQRLADLILGMSCQQDQSDLKLAIEIPMLAEAPDFADLADTVICITSLSSIRIQRAQARGMALEDIKHRMALQATDEERAEICDVVIENNGSLESLHEKLDAWLQLQQHEQMF